MPATYDIQEQLVWFHLVGEYTVQEVVSALDAMFVDPEFPSKPLLLMDVTRSTSLEDRSIDDLRFMARHLAEISPRFGERMAIAAGTRLHYGMMRMAEVYSDTSGFTARAFLSTEEAMDWLVPHDIE